MHTLEYDYNSQYLIVFHNKILFKYHLKLLHSTTLPCDVFTGIYIRLILPITIMHITICVSQVVSIVIVIWNDELRLDVAYI